MQLGAATALCFFYVALLSLLLAPLRSLVIAPTYRSQHGTFGGRAHTLALWEKKERVPTTAEMRWEVRPVGVVESPYLEKFNTPKQATISTRDGGAQHGKIRLYPEFFDCLDKLQGFDYIWVVSLMHLNKGFKTKIRPQPRPEMETQPPREVGLFCSRAPHRPNPIALSCLQVVSVDVAEGIVEVLGLDLLNDTPVLDIKPYIPAFDAFPEARAGWMDSIFSDPEEGRKGGYQNIYSSRGMRMARRSEKRRELLGEKLVSDAEDGGGSASGLEGSKSAFSAESDSDNIT